MKVNLDKQVPTPQGEPLIERVLKDGKPFEIKVTVRHILLRALQDGYEPSQPMNMVDYAKNFRLKNLVTSDKKEIDIKAGDIEFLKSLLSRLHQNINMNPMMIAWVLNEIEPFKSADE